MRSGKTPYYPNYITYKDRCKDLELESLATRLTKREVELALKLEGDTLFARTYLKRNSSTHQMTARRSTARKYHEPEAKSSSGTTSPAFTVPRILNRIYQGKGKAGWPTQRRPRYFERKLKRLQSSKPRQVNDPSSENIVPRKRTYSGLHANEASPIGQSSTGLQTPWQR